MSPKDGNQLGGSGSNANKRQGGLELRQREGSLLDLRELNDVTQQWVPGTGFVLREEVTEKVEQRMASRFFT